MPKKAATAIAIITLVVIAGLILYRWFFIPMSFS
jgi:hypothetical protein